MKKSLSLYMNETKTLLNNAIHFKVDSNVFVYNNIFDVSHKKKQFNFTLQTKSLDFKLTRSAGVILKTSNSKNLKFFKKSHHNINTLIFRLKLFFSGFFQYIYIYNIKNPNKKSILLFKKLYPQNIKYIKYIIAPKSWNHSTKPVKRIKRRVVKMLKNV